MKVAAAIVQMIAIIHVTEVVMLVARNRVQIHVEPTAILNVLAGRAMENV